MINISRNEIQSIQPFTFTDLSTLQAIDLSMNQLHSDEFLVQAGEMRWINLSSNAFQRMDLSALKTIDNVYLHKNPWNCSWLIDALMNKEHRSTNIEFGFAFDHNTQEQFGNSGTEEVECFDNRQSTEKPVMRKIVIITSDQCDNRKNNSSESKVIIFWWSSRSRIQSSIQFTLKRALYFSEKTNNQHISTHIQQIVERRIRLQSVPIVDCSGSVHCHWSSAPGKILLRTIGDEERTISHRATRESTQRYRWLFCEEKQTKNTRLNIRQVKPLPIR